MHTKMRGRATRCDEREYETMEETESVSDRVRAWEQRHTRYESSISIGNGTLEYERKHGSDLEDQRPRNEPERHCTTHRQSNAELPAESKMTTMAADQPRGGLSPPIRAAGGTMCEKAALEPLVNSAVSANAMVSRNDPIRQFANAGTSFRTFAPLRAQIADEDSGFHAACEPHAASTATQLPADTAGRPAAVSLATTVTNAIAAALSSGETVHIRFSPSSDGGFLASVSADSDSMSVGYVACATAAPSAVDDEPEWLLDAAKTLANDTPIPPPPMPAEPTPAALPDAPSSEFKLPHSVRGQKKCHRAASIIATGFRAKPMMVKARQYLIRHRQAAIAIATAARGMLLYSRLRRAMMAKSSLSRALSAWQERSRPLWIVPPARLLVLGRAMASWAALRGSRAVTDEPVVPTRLQSEELRVDEADGRAYTLHEFIAEYGGMNEWHRAGRLQPGCGVLHADMQRNGPAQHGGRAYRPHDQYASPVGVRSLPHPSPLCDSAPLPSPDHMLSYDERYRLSYIARRKSVPGLVGMDQALAMDSPMSSPSPWSLMHQPPWQRAQTDSFQPLSNPMAFGTSGMQCAGFVGTYPHMPQASAGKLRFDGGYDSDGAPVGEMVRAEAARKGEIEFMANVPPGWHDNWGGTGRSYDSCVFGYVGQDDYDQQCGWGSEASRPPDYADPEDEAAYPYGVIYEDEPGYESDGYWRDDQRSADVSPTDGDDGEHSDGQDYAGSDAGYDDIESPNR